MKSLIKLASLIVLIAGLAHADDPPGATLIARADPPKPLKLKDGERITLLGGTFIERMQTHGYFETLVTQTHPDKHITFRNLGWSGDTVWGESRAVFGAQPDGFKRLISDVQLTKPTLLIVAYGHNEAEAGPPGLQRFRDGLGKLLDELEKTKAAIVLLSPHRRENIGPPLPDHAEYNANVVTYAKAIEDIAGQRGHRYVNLLSLITRNSELEEGNDRHTTNGLHLSAYGYYREADTIAYEMGLSSVDRSFRVLEVEPFGDFAEFALGDEGFDAKGFQFTATAKMLPAPLPPVDAPPDSLTYRHGDYWTITDLAPGQYELRIDGKPAAQGSDEDFDITSAVRFRGGPEIEQEAALRQLIREKNELFFHRYRPANETYLFLFRKHEQGNNAAEIPKFDPLIEAKEKEITRLKKPVQHKYEVVQVEEGK